MAADTPDTTKNSIPFDRANVPGPRTAKPLKAEVAGKLVSKAKRPLLVVGTAAVENGIVEIVKTMSDKGIPIAATGGSLGRLIQEGINATYVNLHALVSYMQDSSWKGFDGRGNYDTAIFLGHTYYHASQLMSTLKNFTNVKIISIDRHYHPNANQSFGNLKKEDHLKALQVVIDQLQ